MTTNSPTRNAATKFLEGKFPPLEIGAMAAPIKLTEQSGRVLSLSDYSLSGFYIALLFTDLENTALKDFAKHRQKFEDSGIKLVIVGTHTDSSAPRNIMRDVGLDCPVLTDPGGSSFAAYGLLLGTDIPGPMSHRTVLITPMGTVRTILDHPDVNNHPEQILRTVNEAKQIEHKRWAPSHAPILTIPSVLSETECQQMIDHFNASDRYHHGPLSTAPKDGGFKMLIFENNRQDRVDHIIKDPEISQLLNNRIGTHIIPWIKKAFSVDINRREDLHIARYNGPREGTKLGHRDNVSPQTAYRRFALSMSLNTGFEGGEIVFKEFSDQGYAPPAGTAMVFSSSLLHEVLETTKGIRYNLISHFFVQ